MHKSPIVLAMAVLAAGPIAASAQTPATSKAEVMATVHQFVDAFNKGDTKVVLAACADQTSIIDEFPPHEWHGAGACARWSSDYDTDARKNGITDGVVTLRDPSHVDIAADRAYVVVPADYSFKKNGKPVKEVGSVFTLVLHKGQAGWKLTGWAWAKH
ncbi:MAG: nuclear transport factor 2 family protein [Gemmatimonadaceae bacterium]|nr:nuclear transport factor 2 family protein [Gemmatimonadaceae bacterium]